MYQRRRWIIVVAVTGVLVASAAAQPAIKIEVATVQNGVAYVKGNGATKGAVITWQGFTVTTANNTNGGFSFLSVLPNNCSGQLSDGVSSLNVAVLGCTPVMPGVPVVKTGQTISHFTGDDGAQQKGVAWPDPRFTNNGNGTVTDNLTGLIWLQNANCFGTRALGEALLDANGLKHGQCGLSDDSVAGDWRLPNVRELQSLFDYGRTSPNLPTGHPFTSVQNSNYWSSTFYAATGGNDGWYISFDSGLTSAALAGSRLFVLAVRGGS